MSPSSGQSFAERHGGFVISAVFHAAFFVMLHNVRPPADRPVVKPEPQAIRIELTPLQETAVLEMPAMPPVTDWTENVATVADPAEEETSQSAEGDPSEPSVRPEESDERQIAALPSPALPLDIEALRFEPEPTALTEPDLLIQESDPETPESSSTDEAAESILLDERIKAYLEDRERRLTEYNEAVGQRGSDLVAQKLSLARASLEGKRWLETTEGGQEGAIRSFTSSGVDPKIAEEVYSRYGIRAFDQFVDINRSDNTSYLNSARIGKDQFVRREGRGMFRVLSIPQSAYAFLASLERDALVERGHDPARTRILEVEFGIGSVGTQYDLIVTNMKVAPMEFRP